MSMSIIHYKFNSYIIKNYNNLISSYCNVYESYLNYEIKSIIYDLILHYIIYRNDSHNVFEYIYCDPPLHDINNVLIYPSKFHKIKFNISFSLNFNYIEFEEYKHRVNNVKIRLPFNQNNINILKTILSTNNF